VNTKSTKRILICPLDWGLGHATRCIPIVNELLQRGCEVMIASSGQALSLLKNEFPHLAFEELPSYNPRYSTWLPMTVSMALQLPKFMNIVKKEHECLEKIVTEKNIDLVISDNRYGCWSEKIKSIFITHQVNILVPWYLNDWVSHFNQTQIRKFARCWVPDYKGNRSLAGELSQTAGDNFRFIGPLSRLTKLTSVEKRYDILAIVSGPEPQRSEFENLLRRALINANKEALLVKGIPSNSTIVNDGLLHEVDFLSATELNIAIHASDVVVCRSGYSTVMDLITLSKSAILIPTPGQTEQEYLATSLKEKGIMYSENQNNFNLNRAVHEMKSYTRKFDFDNSSLLLSKAIDEVI
jgi:uncharacterized protein (TIGR00661 family)